MSRYFVKPSAWVADDLWEGAYTEQPTVQVADHEATDTGLVDAGGNAIWKAPNPMGFGRDDEW